MWLGWRECRLEGVGRVVGWVGVGNDGTGKRMSGVRYPTTNTHAVGVLLLLLPHAGDGSPCRTWLFPNKGETKLDAVRAAAGGRRGGEEGRGPGASRRLAADPAGRWD